MGYESFGSFFNQAKPFLGVIFLQFGYAGNSIISKYALNQGMNQHILVVFRYTIATLSISPFALVLDRKIRPKMTLSIFFKILLLGLLEPTLDQNLYYTGMKYTTATFATTMCNVLPAFAFMMAWMCRLEKVNLKKLHSVGKILGTVVTIGGATIMTLVTGPMLPLPWTHSVQNAPNSSSIIKQDPIKGAMFMGVGCFCWSAFIILQAITLKSYPAPLSLTALICCMGALESSIFALVIEKGNTSAWAIHLDSKLLAAAAYSGVISSAVAYFIQGVIMRTKGPVFVTSFSPLSMVIVAILSSFLLSEVLYLGRVIGAIVIIIGLYLVLWGKSKDPPLSEKLAALSIGDDLNAVKNECFDKEYAEKDMESQVKSREESV